MRRSRARIEKSIDEKITCVVPNSVTADIKLAINEKETGKTVILPSANIYSLLVFCLPPVKR